MSDLRPELRARRRRLSPDEQRARAEAVASLVTGHPWVAEAAVIASYRATDGELDPSRIDTVARTRGGRTVYPVVSAGELVFREWDGETPVSEGAFGIEEPTGPAVALARIDVVLVPVVGFDEQGNRLGRGGGFYDRALTPRPRARLVGLAHDEQQLEPWQPAPWDVPLDAVATPTRWISGRAAQG